MEAGASSDPQAIRDFHHPDFFAVWETSFANLDEYLEWLLLENEINSPTTNVESLHEDEKLIIMNNTIEDGSKTYVISKKRIVYFTTLNCRQYGHSRTHSISSGVNYANHFYNNAYLIFNHGIW